MLKKFVFLAALMSAPLANACEDFSGAYIGELDGDTVIISLKQEACASIETSIQTLGEELTQALDIDLNSGQSSFIKTIDDGNGFLLNADIFGNYLKITLRDTELFSDVQTLELVQLKDDNLRFIYKEDSESDAEVGVMARMNIDQAKELAQSLAPETEEVVAANDN